MLHACAPNMEASETNTQRAATGLKDAPEPDGDVTR